MRVLVGLTAASWLAAAPVLAQPAAGTAIGYPSVAVALDALHADPGVVFRTQDGWTLAEDQANLTFWSFPPPGHPAYPSAVKRRLVRAGEGLDLEMNIACEAPKDACDDLVRTFQARNQQMIQAMRAGR